MEPDARLTKTLSTLSRIRFGGAAIRVQRQLVGGYGNQTLLVSVLDRQLVVRRHARGNPAVEEAILARLQGMVAVPSVVFADPTGDVVGEPLMVMSFLSGDRLDVALSSAEPRAAGRLGTLVGAELAAVSRVRFGRPGFFHGPDLIPKAEAGLDLEAFVAERLDGPAAQAAIPAGERAAFLDVVRASSGLLASVKGEDRLVHADFNCKNILVDRLGGDWQVTAVLDWEFALSGSPLIDVANMLREPDTLTPGFADAFVHGFRDAGGDLPDNWRQVSRTLDLFSLADFLRRPPDHPFFAVAVRLLREMARRGALAPLAGL